MPFGLRSIWFQLTAELIMIVWFCWRFFARFGAGAFDGPDGLVTLGKSMLWFVVAMVVLVIGIHIFGLIALAIARGGEEPDTTTDERDRAIELSGLKVAHTISGTGFLVAMVLFVFGQPVPLAVAALFLAGLAGEVAANVVRLRRYAED